MSDEHHDDAHLDEHEKSYWRVLWALAILTVTEVGITFIPGISKMMLGLTLVPMSTAKIILIAAFFMHLKFDNKRLALVVASPIGFSLCLFLIPLLEALSK